MPDAVRKAVLPVAGAGTRLLPASKAVPKELLPIVDVPAVEMVVAECAAAGLGEVVLVTARGKSAIEDHFDRAPPLEELLERRGKAADLARVRRSSELARLIAVRQPEPAGLGHAVLCARPAVGAEPFALLLPDDIFEADPPAIAQLLEHHRRTGLAVVGLQEVPAEHVHRYGIADVDPISDGFWRIRGLVEKPAPERAPSRLAVPGRYVLTPDVFDLLETTRPGTGGEIQITDALDRLARQGRLLGALLRGRRFDVGDRLGYLQAQVHFALGRDDLRTAFEAFLRERLGP